MNKELDNSIFGINHGKILSTEVIQGMRQFIDELTILYPRMISSSISEIEKLIEPDEKLNQFSIDLFKKGKDALHILKVTINENLFVAKIYDFRLKDILHYILSINSFLGKMPGVINLENNESLSLHPLDVYAFSNFIVNGRGYTVIFQELSNGKLYSDFIEEYRPKINLLYHARQFTEKNGFIFDFMPDNFRLDYNIEKHIYTLDYLDIFYFMDPGISQDAKDLANRIINNDLSETGIIVKLN